MVSTGHRVLSGSSHPASSCLRYSEGIAIEGGHHTQLAIIPFIPVLLKAKMLSRCRACKAVASNHMHLPSRGFHSERDTVSHAASMSVQTLVCKS